MSEASARTRYGASDVVPATAKTRRTMSLLWIILIVILVLALFGFIGRGRF
jgi:hypothetical protein